jgi:hypothetical protein
MTVRRIRGMLVGRGVIRAAGSTALAAKRAGITARRGSVHGRQLPDSSGTPGRPVPARTAQIGGPVLIAGHLPPLPPATIIHCYAVASSRGIPHH